MLIALVLILLAAGWRVAAVHIPDLVNFAPLMALTFCAAVYIRDRRFWLVPFAALLLSDLYLDHYHAVNFHESWLWQSAAVRALSFAMVLPLGVMVARHRSWATLFGGALAGSLMFYLFTNTDAWVRDPAYLKTAAGWWQAMTVGRPEFPPTLYFFRNTFVSDFLFTGIFALAMEWAAARRGEPSLIRLASPTLKPTGR
jgi:hypothetical protein